MPTTVVLEAKGPLPVSGTFSLPFSATAAVLVVYGSGFTGKAQTTIGCEIFLNGGDTTKAATVFANDANTHLTFVPGCVLVQDDADDSAGASSTSPSYTVELQNYGTNTVTDYNDSYLVLLHH